MFPPHPQASLPMPQNFTFHGFCLPYFVLSSGIGLLPPGCVVYFTQSASSCGVPLPTLPLRYGSAPSTSHMFKNSLVPKLLSSFTLPHHTLSMDGRLSLGPIPSFQW